VFWLSKGKIDIPQQAQDIISLFMDGATTLLIVYFRIYHTTTITPESAQKVMSDAG
jgi:hypothetical protein